MGGTGRPFPLDPVTGTIAPVALDAENHRNMADAVRARRREGESGTSNANARRQLQQIERDIQFPQGMPSN
jgi:hypothetical protein